MARQISPKSGLAGAALLCAALTAALGSSVLSAPTSWASVVGTKAKPAVEDCGLPPAAVKPKSLTLACADAGDLGMDLKWLSWGSAEAYATGEYEWHICTPDCAASNKWGKAAANFTLEGPASTRAGWLFEKLVVKITGKVPAGTPKQQIYNFKPLITR